MKAKSCSRNQCRKIPTQTGQTTIDPQNQLLEALTSAGSKPKGQRFISYSSYSRKRLARTHNQTDGSNTLPVVVSGIRSYQITGLFADHDGWRIGVTTDDFRHDRAVGYT